MKLKQTFVFETNSQDEAERISLGEEHRVMLPIRHAPLVTGTIFFFFPNLTVPSFYAAEVLAIRVGHADDLMKRALVNAHNVFMVLEDKNDREQMVLISWKGKKVLTSREEVQNEKYKNGELFEDTD